MTKKGLRSRVPAKAMSAKDLELFHRISALLHTLRCIATYEDQLCTLMHESGSVDSLSADLKIDLRDLIEKMPSHEYTHDLQAVEKALSTIDLIDQKHSRVPTKVSVPLKKAKQKTSR